MKARTAGEIERAIRAGDVREREAQHLLDIPRRPSALSSTGSLSSAAAHGEAAGAEHDVVDIGGNPGGVVTRATASGKREGAGGDARQLRVHGYQASEVGGQRLRRNFMRRAEA